MSVNRVDALHVRASTLGESLPAWFRYLLGVGVLAAVYFGSAHIGYAFNFAGPVAAILWLPAGVGIAFLYLGGIRLWPGALIGDLLVNDYNALPIGSALGQTCGNVLEVVAAAFLIQRFVPSGNPLVRIADLGRMLGALALAAAVSATVGTLSSRLGGVIDTDELAHVWRTWWLGDAAGALVVVPFAIAWYRPDPRLREGRRIEFLLVLCAVVGLTELAFRTTRPLAYLVFPALIWAALRFGQRGATLAVVVAVLMAVWNTTHYEGPFTYASFSTSVLATQLYIAVAALSTLFLAALVSEREEYAERLGASRVQLLDAADDARRQIERDLHDGAQQRLLALGVHLRLAAERSREQPDQAPVLFERAEHELQAAVDELRDLAHGIHPMVLRDLGLGNAIRSLAARSAVPVELVELPGTRLGDTAEATAYYVVAEALTNSLRHGRPTEISIRASAVNGVVDLEVADDGVGGAAESKGSGLRGLRERVEAVGGRLTVESPTGGGTRVAATIPTAATNGGSS
jgi:signal transduction histidine kinase